MELTQYLTQAYMEPHRHYHNLEHIAQMLNMGGKRLSWTQMWAVWFHDVVYKVGSQTNEEDSAYMAEEYLGKHLGSDIELVKEIIMSTKDHIARCGEAELVVDLDLAVLASKPVEYNRYVDNIEEECRWVYSEDIFVEKRIEWLSVMLERDKIFYRHPHLEKEARDNMRLELEVLEFWN